MIRILGLTDLPILPSWEHDPSFGEGGQCRFAILQTSLSAFLVLS